MKKCIIKLSVRREQMKDWVEISQRLIMLGQLGLSLMMPILICLGICYLLVTKAGLGLWIYIPGFIFGLGASFMTAYKMWLSVTAKEKKKAQEEPPAFNRHS